MVIEVGLRVVRGPDWKWGLQDDGEGHVGTVVEIGKQGSTTSPDKTVVVHWDSGSRTNYRVGYQGAYDLRIFDNATLGIRHRDISCSGCRKQELFGIRWSCSKCHNLNLCTDCYMTDIHDLSHCFIRIESHSSTGVKVGKRAGAVKIQSRGIFAGAKVQRGPDWDWGNQDGGEGKIGKAVDIRGWENESERSVVCVAWQTGPTNVYRLGHKGKVDIKYVTEAQGWVYYRDHLPVLGASRDGAHNSAHTQFRVGDKVRVDLEVEILKAMQEGHGGWNPKMADYIGKVGTVHRITERGDVRVQHEGCSNRWTFHPGALTKVHQFAVGDLVKIADSLNLVKSLQRDHGDWTDMMRAALGATGKVLKVYADGDLRVAVANQTWTFNPACCSLVSSVVQSQQDLHPKQQQFKVLDGAPSSRGKPLDTQTFAADVLVREAAEGHLNAVRDVIAKHPAEVDAKSSGKTALQVGCHQGHLPLVDLLIASGADLECRDDDGDTALHYSAFGNQALVMKRLLEKGSQIDALNTGGCTPLHVAVNKQHVDCVKVLLQHKCQVNIQDTYGDSALHDSIGKEQRDIVDLLCDFPGTDFSLRNKRGFNCLHHAALKGNAYATERILARCSTLVDVRKDDAFSSLHLAALNGHCHVVDVLLTKGNADIEIRNKRQQTPLLLATTQGHANIIKLLIEKGADISAVDEDGDSCLHLALMRQTSPADLDDSPGLAEIRQELHLDADTSSLRAVAAYLVYKGASLHLKNKQGKSPLDIVQEQNVVDLLKKFESADLLGGELEKRECCVCSDDHADVIFQPCGHRIVCGDCCIKMKKCLDCQAPITAKTRLDGTIITEAMVARPSELEELQQRVLDMEEHINCTICLERKKNIVFLCGHGACQVCSEPLRICHMCRKPISKRINVF